MSLASRAARLMRDVERVQKRLDEDEDQTEALRLMRQEMDRQRLHIGNLQVQLSMAINEVLTLRRANKAFAKAAEARGEPIDEIVIHRTVDIEDQPTS